MPGAPDPQAEDQHQCVRDLATSKARLGSTSCPPRHPSAAAPRPVHVFHETDPWYQKGWGPLLYTIILAISPISFFTVLEEEEEDF